MKITGLYFHTCAVGNPFGGTLCPIRGLCGDTYVIACARNKVSDIIHSVISRNTIGLVWALPGHIVTVAFLEITVNPCDRDALLFCWSAEIIHTERSWLFKRRDMRDVNATWQQIWMSKRYRNQARTCGDHMDLNRLALKVHGAHCRNRHVVLSPRQQRIKDMTGAVARYVFLSLRWSDSQPVREWTVCHQRSCLPPDIDGGGCLRQDVDWPGRIGDCKRGATSS